ncbi:uncharacterized protein [Primulina huaijiensis]|uniref:uncharacterized protein n=1 Tax=Primulina huaijiensis TaxID=1492673 RepID=UPI003CC73308
MSETGAAVTPPEMVVTEQQIAEELTSLLRDVNAFTSLNGVVQQLETKLRVDLNQKIDFIRSQIHHFLLMQSQPHNQQQDSFSLHETPKFNPVSSPRFAPNAIVHQSSVDYGFGSPLPSPLLSSQLPPPPSVKTPSVPTANTSAKESVPVVRKRRGGPGGLNKLCGVSPELQVIVGQPTLPRTEIVKQLWAYIRKHTLQDPNNKRKIICNDELRLVFDTDCTDMFKMNKLLAKHIIPLEPTKQKAQYSKIPKADVESGSKRDDPVPIVLISEALASFFETDEREMSQAEVLRQMWEYIKLNQLEDPSNAIVITCDAKLQGLLGCESISALGIPETLSRLHLSKKS